MRELDYFDFYRALAREDLGPWRWPSTGEGLAVTIEHRGDDVIVRLFRPHSRKRWYFPAGWDGWCFSFVAMKRSTRAPAWVAPPNLGRDDLAYFNDVVKPVVVAEVVEFGRLLWPSPAIVRRRT